MNAPFQLSPYERQLSIEWTYSRKHVDRAIRRALMQNPDTLQRIAHGVQLVTDWMNQEYYESKKARIEQLKPLDLQELVVDMFVGIAYAQRPELFTSVSGQLAARLRFSDRKDAITTVAELIAVLAETDLFDVLKLGKNSSLMVQSQMVLDDQLVEYINNCVYLPPMVCEPQEIRDNHHSGYLTHNDSVILKHYNHHDGDVCLDVINLQNSIPLSLDVEFITTVEETPSKDLDEIPGSQFKSARERQIMLQQKLDDWEHFKTQSIKVYALMVGHGNRFWLTHKVDKRGRLYAQGYHINTQGTKYKKAAVELADKEIVTGVPT